MGRSKPKPVLVEFKRGKLGFWAGGQKVWVDYVLVYDAEGPSQRPVNPVAIIL
jgi:hypothetical protein